MGPPTGYHYEGEGGGLATFAVWLVRVAFIAGAAVAVLYVGGWFAILVGVFSLSAVLVRD